ncbi:MAG: YdcF family protein [Deltaproteobacteria bacterium]|nr:YdcF family protein [Deltaproteobacteria bacterium]
MPEKFKRLNRFIRWFSSAFTAVFLIIMFTPVANYAAKTLIVRHPEPGAADIIAVLGGGAYRNGVLGAASSERLIKGLILFKSGNAPRIIFSGGTIIEPSKKFIHTVFKRDRSVAIGIQESEIMRDTALIFGVPDEAAEADPASTNTYENLRNISAYMNDKGLKKCILVTSPTHMLRALLVSKALKLDCDAAPVDDYTAQRSGALDRLTLLREVLWEYAALALYKVYGYI